MAAAMAETGVAQTLMALPTNTTLPSPTFTSTPLPTQTQTSTILAGTQTATAFTASGTMVNALPAPVSGTGIIITALI